MTSPTKMGGSALRKKRILQNKTMARKLDISLSPIILKYAETVLVNCNPSASIK